MRSGSLGFLRPFAVVVLLLCTAAAVHAQSYQTQALNKGQLYTNASLLDDFDHDGDLDIILIRAGNSSAPAAILWLENDATQQFPQHLLYTDNSMRRPQDIRKCDCDGDGRTDYVVADAGTSGSNGQVFVLQRQANGTFVKWTVAAGSDFKQADVGDFNHDGHPDVVAVASGSTTVNVYLNDGSFNFTNRTLATAVSAVDQVQAVDIDGDGDVDIVCSGWIFRNIGDGTFDAGQQLITYVSNSFAFGMAVADLNGDGKLDVLAFAGLGPGGLYFFNAATNFSTSVLDVAPGGELGGDIRVVDLDGNGLKEVIRQNIYTNVTTVLYQDAPMTFRRVDIIRHWDSSGGPSRMAVGDLDGDGDPDLVFPGNGLFEQDFYWFENVGGKLFQHRLYGTFRGVQHVKVVDLDGDGDLDLLVTIGENITADDQVIWLENRGTRGFITWLIADDLKSPFGVEAADVDGDGRLDVIVSASDTNSLSWYGRIGPSWQSHTIDTNLNHPLGIAVADLDRDGDGDVVATSGNDAKIFWYSNDGHGVFQRRIVDANLTNPRDVKVADLDNDGDLDIAAAAASDNSTAVYLNDGAQNFTRQVLQTGFIGAAIDIGDYDRSGVPDIVVAYNSSRSSDPDVVAYQFQSGGTFASSTLVASLHNVTAVRLADVDRDGALDLLVGSDTPGDTSPLALFMNRGGFGQPIELLPKTSGSIFSIDSGNLDSDNAVEIVATDYRFGALDRFDSTAVSGPASPQISFTATPSVIDLGTPVTLTWSTTFADSVTIDNGIGTVATSGSTVVSELVAPVTFNLTATGPGGTTTAPVTVTVLNPLTAGISAVPSSIHTGESATLIWSSTGTTNVSLDDSVVILSTQQVPAQGTKSVSPTVTTHYTLTARVGNFRVSSSTDVTVRSAAAPVIGSFTAAPPAITAGQSASLLWNSSGGVSAAIDHGVGAVNAASGSVPVSPALTTTYTLTVNGPGGVAVRSLTLPVGTSEAATVSTVAGTGQAGSADGAPAQATFTKPFAVAVMPHTQSPSDSRVSADAALSFDIFVLDSNHTIRRIAPDGTTTTFAGTAGVRGSKNGFRTAATFDFSNYVGAIAANTDGTFDVVDAGGVQRHIDLAGNVANLCVSCARYPLPAGLVRLPDRTTLISDAGSHTITRVSPAGATTVIGQTGKPGFHDGAADQAQFYRPRGLTVDTAGNVYVLDTGNNAIRKITSQNVVSTLTVAGSATKGGDLVLGCCASGITPAPGGGVYITDPGSNTVKQIAPDGSITTVAGSGAAGSANGTGANASFSAPLGVATAPDGSLVVTDTDNHKVRSILTPAAAARRRAAKH